MFHAYKVGQLAVIKTQERALEKGWAFCIPTVEERFDAIVVEPLGKCHKIQIKHTDRPPSTCEGSVVVDFRKQTRNNGKYKLYTRKEIDAVVVFIPNFGMVWLPPEIFEGRTTLSLRIQAAKNGQKKGVTLAEDFRW